MLREEPQIQLDELRLSAELDHPGSARWLSLLSRRPNSIRNSIQVVQEHDVKNMMKTQDLDVHNDMTAEGEHERGQWGNQIEFLLACLGYAVGLGNVWRFPYLTFKNGGGAFLIPYIISLTIAGLPVFFLELSIGQYSSLGPNVLFSKMVPIFQGLGWGMVTVSALVALYYNMIIAWVLFYFAESFTSELPWATCRHSWNTEDCYSNRENVYCQKTLNDSEAVFFNKQCWNGTMVGAKGLLQLVEDMKNESLLKSPSDEYFHRHMLEISDSLEDLGGLSWRLVLCLLAAWIIVFLCLVKGVQSTGKVVYFTATFPYVVLFILLIRGATLEGAGDGIYFYLVPKWHKLLTMEIWVNAATQIFYSLGPAFGGLITMSSYNKFTNNCLRDALIVAVGNCATSVFAGFVIFSIIGFVARDLHKDVKDVAEKGPGLAFIIYPEALSRMPAGPFFSVLFFFMLVTLGLDSQFAMLETVTTALMDQFPYFRQYKHFVVAAACGFMFLVGLPLCSRGGFYIFTLINDYSAGYCLVILALTEVLITVYIYGMNRFVKDIETMIGYKPNWYWKICWYALTPLLLICILIFSLSGYEKSSYRSYTFTARAEAIGWLLSVISIMWIPIFAVYKVISFRKQGKHWKALFTADPDYCPAHERGRRQVTNDIQMKQHNTSGEGNDASVTEASGQPYQNNI